MTDHDVAPADYAPPDVEPAIVQQPAAQLAAVNPKTAVGQLKIDVSTVPPVSLLYLAAAHDTGALKYGPFNWLETPVAARTYIAAAMRYLQLFAAGIEIDYAVDSQGTALAFRFDAETGKHVLHERGQPIPDPAGRPFGRGLPHLALAMANCSILLSAGAAGMLNDDRAKMIELDQVLRDLSALKADWPRMAA